jgi:hypothetical protein
VRSANRQFRADCEVVPCYQSPPYKTLNDGPLNSKANRYRTAMAKSGSGGLLGGPLARLGDFGELARFYVVDEAAYGDVADEGMIFDAGDLAADILLDVFEGMEGGGRDGGDAGLVLEFVEELIVGEGDHAAIGVVDDDEFLGAQQVMRNDQGAQRVFGGDAAGVANNVSVASFEAEKLFDAEARVHAGEDG